MAMRLLLAAAFGWAGLVSLAFGQNPTPTPRTAASGKTVDWPGVSMTARGNESVAGRIKRSWGSLSYVEYGFAKRLGLPMIHLQNKAGRYIEPGLDSGRAALAANVGQIPSNLRVFLPDPEGQDSYPIVTFTWLLLHDQYPDQAKGAALKRFVNWALADGQRYSGEEGYIPLPDGVATRTRRCTAFSKPWAC